MAAEKSESVHQYRLGRIVGTVWLNDDENGHGRHSVIHQPAVQAERRRRLAASHHLRPRRPPADRQGGRPLPHQSAPQGAKACSHGREPVVYGTEVQEPRRGGGLEE